MIIDTEHLRMAVQSRDDDTDHEHCSMSRLNFEESRCLKALNLISEIEKLYHELLTVPSSAVHFREI